MALEKLNEITKEQNNVLDNDIAWLNSNYIIEKWEKYIRNSKSNWEERNFSDWQDYIKFIASRNPLWLWEYNEALKFMMLIDFIKWVNKDLINKKYEVGSTLSDDIKNKREIDYKNSLKESFLIEKGKFDKRYKKTLIEKYWDDGYLEIFKDIVELIVEFYKDEDMAKIFKEAVL